ncbi:DUF2283 domain-containing protein [Georgenia sp. TF02-10]|uniref:DUF2283 domain-containing protein n=1 Tax=Georgenia sp. TF02-10 TaxID=2917725 RepID=UPI001FA76614|nr:DUF2283 domain-containing protein [Georgenia sp. TF02-10]UNX53527.1 DUF2283 domain-containing protein [Georgenia sp. TF02-10]
MRITYDRDADAAYISLVQKVEPGEATRQVPFIETPNNESQVTLDFDVEGHLLGIEVLVASRALTAELLAEGSPG